LLVRSLRFRMANSSYRGLRFAFTGDTGEGYKVFVLWPLLAGLTLGLLMPVAHQRLKQYQHGNTRFATAPFAFSASARAFWRVYMGISLISVALFAVGVLLIGALMRMASGSPLMAVGTALASGIALALSAAMVRPIFRARMQNLIWNHTTL